MALTQVPIELSSTPGIVDNSNATAITIDSSENVGIGTSSPSGQLHISGSGSQALKITSSDSGGSNLVFTASGTAGDINMANGLPLTFKTASTERMRIDSSGNLLVGKTSSNSATVGVEARGTGKLLASATSGFSGFFNRLSTDGTIIEFAKDDTTVGSIGAVAGDIVIGTGACGIRFHDGTPALQPRNTDGSANNDAIDIGLTGNRFKDLYLSGVAYATGVEITGSGNRGVQITTANTGSGYINFGDPQDSNVGLIAYDHNVNALYMRTSGSERIRILSTGGITFNGDTAQANALDDYEEGTWTPTLTGGTSAGTTTYNGRSADYTKIGNTVRVGFYISFTAATGTGQLRLGGLPFTQNADNGNNVKLGGIMTDGLNWDVDGSLILMGTIDTTFMRVGLSRDDTAIHLQNVTNETATIWGSLTYITNS
jgi:hypothetical protein